MTTLIGSALSRIRIFLRCAWLDPHVRVTAMRDRSGRRPALICYGMDLTPRLTPIAWDETNAGILEWKEVTL